MLIEAFSRKIADIKRNTAFFRIWRCALIRKEAFRVSETGKGLESVGNKRLQGVLPECLRPARLYGNSVAPGKKAMDGILCPECLRPARLYGN